MSSFFAFIIALAKTSAILKSSIEKFYEMYVQDQVGDLNSSTESRGQQRHIITQKINEAKTHEEKRILFTILNDLNYGVRGMPKAGDVPNPKG